MNHERIISQTVVTIPLSLYIHFPWCLSKCPYCDFNSYALSDKKIIDEYIRRLLMDLAIEGEAKHGNELKSIYFGGGTPSLLSPNNIISILDQIRNYFSLASDVEITIEANPGTITLEACQMFKIAGINRFSIGIQSFDDEKLKSIHRAHSAQQAIMAVEAVKLSGFSNFNLDLMYGLPGQNAASAAFDLQIALDFKPPHLSWYQLTLEPNSFLRTNPLGLPQEEELWDIQQTGQDLLSKNGIAQYEVSAYCASPNYKCQHNMNYWQYGDYIGVGAGAHGKITLSNYLVKRYVKISDPYKYCQAESFIESDETVLNDKLPLEFMLNALRLYQPISYDLFQKRTGFTIDAIEKQLNYAKKLGLIELKNNAVIVTNHGKNFLNDLLEIFL
ncbi:MAG: radical SAM family heme chaperone HemW [Gammaproteobacteria bacterium]|nr:radical SAM family heme chaperone HemW [Gammaproteobacteria bacterium]